jgi:hypothetical protein
LGAFVGQVYGTLGQATAHIAKQAARGSSVPEVGTITGAASLEPVQRPRLGTGLKFKPLLGRHAHKDRDQLTV